MSAAGKGRRTAKKDRDRKPRGAEGSVFFAFRERIYQEKNLMYNLDKQHKIFKKYMILLTNR